MPAKKRLTALSAAHLMAGVERGFTAGDDEIEYESHCTGAARGRGGSIAVLKVWLALDLASLGVGWHTAADLRLLVEDLREAIKLLEGRKS